MECLRKISGGWFRSNQRNGVTKVEVETGGVDIFNAAQRAVPDHLVIMIDGLAGEEGISTNLWERRKTTNSSNEGGERKKGERKWKYAWYLRSLSMTLCLSMVLIATYWPLVLSTASLTLAKLPSPIVRPILYFPMLLAGNAIF